MDQPSSQSPNSDLKPARHGAGSNGAEIDDAGNQQMIADRLMAALTGGSLDQLADAREAFLQQSSGAREKKQTEATTSSRKRQAAPPAEDFSIPHELERHLEHRPARRSSAEVGFAPVDELRSAARTGVRTEGTHRRN